MHSTKDEHSHAERAVPRAPGTPPSPGGHARRQATRERNTLGGRHQPSWEIPEVNTKNVRCRIGARGRWAYIALMDGYFVSFERPGLCSVIGTGAVCSLRREQRLPVQERCPFLGWQRGARLRHSGC